MPSAYNVPMASDVLPDPDTPATATVRHSGTSTSISRRLLCRAPRTPMTAGRVSGTGMSPASIRQPKRTGLRARRAAPRQGRRWPALACYVRAFSSGVDRSAGPAVEAQRLHDLERGGVGELLDVGGGQDPGVLRDDGRGRALGDRVEVGLDPGPEVLPGRHVEGHRV